MDPKNPSIMNTKKIFKLKRTLNIGSPDAETDDVLFDVFVKTDVLHQVCDTRSQMSILIGRTGTGKSAVIKYIKETQENCVEISPESMSLKFLSNSTILKHFKNLDINLNLFYKVLWKHVFIVELLKLYFQDEKKCSASGSVFYKNIIDNIKKKTSKKNPKRKRAVNYLENWTDDFWKETEYRIKSFEDKIRDTYTTQMGLNIEAINAKIGACKDLEQTFYYEAKAKAESIIHKSQSSDLLEIIGIMEEELFHEHQKKFFVIIDDLDKEWVEDEFRYELISAMIDVVKEFRKLDGVKIVIALRENLNDIVSLSLINKGGQREKLKPLYANLDWTNEELMNFLDNRIKNLSENQLDINTAFQKKRRNNKSGIEYVLERTYKRPRDLITYINLAINEANNKSSFTNDILYKVETKYALYRYQALEDEWRENYGDFSRVTRFLRGIHNGYKLKSLSENDFEEVYLEDDAEIHLSGDLKKAVIEWKNDEIKFIVFLKKIMLILFRIGIIGVKKGPSFPNVFYYNREVLIDRNDITTNSRFYVHPALFSYFKVNVIDQLPEEN
jgi:hypothetical protein